MAEAQKDSKKHSQQANSNHHINDDRSPKEVIHTLHGQQVSSEARQQKSCERQQHAGEGPQLLLHDGCLFAPQMPLVPVVSACWWRKALWSTYQWAGAHAWINEDTGKVSAPTDGTATKALRAAMSSLTNKQEIGLFINQVTAFLDWRKSQKNQKLQFFVWPLEAGFNRLTSLLKSLTFNLK